MRRSHGAEEAGWRWRYGGGMVTRRQCKDRGDAPILCQFHCFLGKDLEGNAGCTYALFGHLGDERSPDFYVYLTPYNTHTTTGDDLTRDHYQVEHCLDKIFTHYKTTVSENCTNYHFRTDGCGLFTRHLCFKNGGRFAHILRAWHTALRIFCTPVRSLEDTPDRVWTL